MESIKFENGIKNYAVNGDESKVISINAADLNLPKRIKEMYAEAEKLEDKYKGTDITAEALADADAELRRIINYTFAADICTPAFGELNIMSPVNGKPLYQNFFEAFMPVLEADIKAALNKDPVRPEVRKYLPDETEKKPKIDISAMTTDEKNALLSQLLT